MTEETTCPLCGEKLKPIPEFYELFCDNPKCVLQGYDENNLKKAIPQIVRIRQEAKDEAYKEYAYQHGDCLLNLPDAELQKIRQKAKQEVFDDLDNWPRCMNCYASFSEENKIKFNVIKKKHGVE